jgi:hypothetical protein
MMERYFKGVQPHTNIEKIKAEIAFLLGPPERALEIAKTGAVLGVLYFFLTASINLLPNLITSSAPFAPFTASSSSYSASK